MLSTYACFFNNQTPFRMLQIVLNDIVYDQKHSLSLGTGPEEAHRGSRFLFTEMSSPRKPGDKAILRTTVPLPGKCLVRCDFVLQCPNLTMFSLTVV